MAQHYGVLHPDAGYSSLHDEFLQDMHDTVWQLVSSRLIVYRFALYACCKITLIKPLQTSNAICASQPLDKLIL